MSDGDVRSWFVENGYTTAIPYSGEYDDADDILVVEADERADSCHLLWAPLARHARRKTLRNRR